jgi:hypothetical protein
MTRMKVFGVAAEVRKESTTGPFGFAQGRLFDYALARLANNASRKISGERSAQDDNSRRVRYGTYDYAQGRL